MGKSSKPLCILLTEKEMLDWEAFRKLAEQGHILLVLEVLLRPYAFPPIDLVMGHRAHYLQPGMEKMLQVAIKGARSQHRKPAP